MDDIKKDDELSQWLSTYGTITAERILGRYNISLPQDEILEAINIPSSFYRHLLQIPLKNVLNGIVIQQASDYHVYAQKLLIDYLLSGESSKEPDSQGAGTRESLEDERQRLVQLGDEFHKLELEQDNLIASSQASLMKISIDWNTKLETTLSKLNSLYKNTNSKIKKNAIRKALIKAFIHCDLVKDQSQKNKYQLIDKLNQTLAVSVGAELKESILTNLSELFQILDALNTKLDEFTVRTNHLSQQAKSFRTQFYEVILRIIELIKLLPEYKIDPEQDAINREPLYFDRTIGER
ncbi:TPA: type 4 secretion system coupling complex assembly protein DotZ [Legionella pneumophila]